VSDRDIWLEHMEDRSGCSDDGFEPEQEAETEAQRVEDEAARRVAANSFKGSKMLIERALGVRL
jgi:hypothetical protein